MTRFQGRIEPFLGALAYFVTFFLVGVWHGQTSIFIVFGLLQGGGVAVNKLYQIKMAQRFGRKRYREFCSNQLYTAISRGVTIVWFAFTLLWFWSDWPTLGRMSMAAGPVALILGAGILIVGVSIALVAWEAARNLLLSVKIDGSSVFRSRYIRTVSNTILVVAVAAVILVMNQPAPDIVYQAF